MQDNKANSNHEAIIALLGMATKQNGLSRSEAVNFAVHIIIATWACRKP